MIRNSWRIFLTTDLQYFTLSLLDLIDLRKFKILTRDLVNLQPTLHSILNALRAANEDQKWRTIRICCYFFKIHFNNHSINPLISSDFILDIFHVQILCQITEPELLSLECRKSVKLITNLVTTISDMWTYLVT